MEEQETPRNHNHTLPPRKRHNPSYWENYIANNNQPIIETQNPTYEFSFRIKPLKILKHTFQAFTDLQYIYGQEAIIQVADQGCEIVVWTFNADTVTDGYGYLALKATGLEGFQCRADFRKAFLLEVIALRFKSIEDKFDNDSVFVYVVEGSDTLSFNFDHGPQFSVNLKKVQKVVEQIPDTISYAFEAVIRSSVLRTMSEKLQKQATAATRCPTTVEVTLKPATMVLQAQEHNVIASSVVLQAQEHRILTEWQNWNSLKIASFTADKASVYLVTKTSVCLVTEPFIGIMVRFHLEELGDLVYLHPAAFKSAVPDQPVPPELPLLGHFRSLLGRFLSMY